MTRITIGMPEFLLAYSFMMYNVSWGLSVLTLTIAIISRLAKALVDYGDKKQNELDKVKQS